MSSRSLLAVSLSALLAFSFSSFAYSAETAAPSELLQLHQLRLTAQKSIGDFYMLNAMEGDLRYARQISDAMKSGEALLQQIQNMPGEGSKALLEQLRQQWSAYASELVALTDTYKSQGFTDLQPVADLATRSQQLQTLSAELYGKIQQESGNNVPALTQLSRDESLLMQRIATDYSSRSAAVGATFIGGSDKNSKSIDELSNEFSSSLSKLEQAPQNTAETRQAVAAINIKWRYIEKSLKNYNEKVVPFLVNKYSNSITDGLEAVSRQYAEKQL
jgi:ActR/RegA family two-component response regulator